MVKDEQKKYLKWVKVSEMKKFASVRSKMFGGLKDFFKIFFEIFFSLVLWYFIYLFFFLGVEIYKRPFKMEIIKMANYYCRKKIFLFKRNFYYRSVLKSNFKFNILNCRKENTNKKLEKKTFNKVLKN